MKVFLLHGDDNVKSYERLKKFIDTAKNRSWEVVNIDDSTRNIKDDLQDTSLFGAERFFILRNTKKITKDVSEWLDQNSEKLMGNLIVYCDNKASATLIKSLPKNTSIEVFALPVLIWNFLDSIKKGNSAFVIQTFHKIIENEAPERIFTMIVKLFRDLYWVKTERNSMQYPEWRISKLKKQADSFTVKEIKDAISTMSDIDVDLKTGFGNIVSSIDLLLVKILE